MKLNTRPLFLACVTLLSMFAASTPAQEQDRTSEIVNRLRLHPAKPSNADASSANEPQGKSENSNATPDSTESCPYSFTSGSGTSFLKYCVTVNGNLASFESPAGVEMLDPTPYPGFESEGYGICDLDAGSAGVVYEDYVLSFTPNWNAPTTIAHTATEVKIARTTSDGLWTLTQTITQVSGTKPYAKVTMALKNNSAETKIVFLLRFAAFQPDSTSFFDEENYDGTDDSAWGYIPTFSSSSNPPYGMMLQNIGNPNPASALLVREGFAIEEVSPPAGPVTCEPTYGAGTVTNEQGGGVYLYAFELTKEQTATVNLKYVSF